MLPFDVKQDQDLQIQETKEEVEKEEAASEFVIEEGALNGELKMFQWLPIKAIVKEALFQNQSA